MKKKPKKLIIEEDIPIGPNERWPLGRYRMDYIREEIRSGRYDFNELFEKFDRMYEANEITYERREKLRKVVHWCMEAWKPKKE